jgi:hypothetical protein
MAEDVPERIHFDDEMRRCATATPFVPFDIVTTSGVRYEVRQQLQLAMGANAVVLVLPKTGLQIVRKNQIAALHIHEPA